MWARKRIDINTCDMMVALGYCVRPYPRQRSLENISRCFDSTQTVVCLSVRSGFDLLLQTTAWSAGSEVIFSGLTIGDMPRIAREHELKVVGVDVDWKTLAPSVDEIESKITSRTRAIVTAHLMGGRNDLAKIGELARRHNLMLIEDCAQSYVGNQHHGSPQADVSMFSFGSIKTNTALGGAVIVVREPDLKSTMQENHASWPFQSRFSYPSRIFKYGIVKTISTWPIAALIRIGFRVRGRNHDSMAAGLAKGFAGPEFFKRIRHQPSDALLSMLSRQIKRFDPSKLAYRKSRGDDLTSTILSRNGDLLPIGSQSEISTHWVFAVPVANPGELTQHLWDLGFDATTHSSLKAVHSDEVHGDSTQIKYVRQGLPNAEKILRHIVFLPIDFPMPKREIERLGDAVARIGVPIGDFDPCPLDRPSYQITAGVNRPRTVA